MVILFPDPAWQGRVSILRIFDSSIFKVPTPRKTSRPRTLNNHFLTDVWWNTHFPGKILESSNGNESENLTPRVFSNHWQDDRYRDKLLKAAGGTQPFVFWCGCVMAQPTTLIRKKQKHVTGRDDWVVPKDVKKGMDRLNSKMNLDGWFI